MKNQPSSAQPRVLMVIKTLDNASGSAGGLRQMAGALRDLGVPCAIVARRVSQIVEDPVLQGITVTRLPGRGSTRFYSGLMRFLRRESAKYDVVHVHGIGLISFCCALAAWRAKKPVIVMPTAAGDKSRLGSWERWSQRVPLLKVLLGKHATRWISISEETSRGLKAVGAAPQKIVDIPYGVNETIFSPASETEKAQARGEFGVPLDEPIFITIGSLKWRKRVDLTIAAFNQFRAQTGRGHLWIVGVGEDREKLEAMARESEARDHIEFLGRLNRLEVAARLRASDVFVLPSEVEGLSNVVLEAMSCALPSIVSRISGNEDLIQHGNNGWLVERGDVPALAQAMLEIAENPAEARRLGDNARQIIVDGFSMQSVAVRLLALYNQTLGRDGAPKTGTT